MCWICQASCLVVPEGELPVVAQIVKFEHIFASTILTHGYWDLNKFGYEPRPFHNGDEIVE